MRARGVVFLTLLFWTFVQPVAAHSPLLVPFVYVPALPMGVPDFCANSAQNVAAGQEVTLSGTLEIGCLGIHGKVKLANGLRLRVDQILVYGDGELTQVDPIGDDIVITYRNFALDQVGDPEEWGHGLIAFGKVRLNGKTKTHGVRLATEVQAGATMLQLGSVPTGWLVGDQLGLLESRQSRTDSHSETVTIAAITGTSVTLTSPTQFSHLGGRVPDGTLVKLPHVANRTRSVVMRSESPTGVRAHSAYIHRADVDLRYVELRDMGRTTADLIDSTTFNADGTVAHRGTNQIGRYVLHLHHLFGPETPQANGKQFTVIGVSINGFEKWGIAVHNAHWGLVQDCTVYDGKGAGIVTEDGSETGNLFAGNVIAKVNHFTITLTEGEASNPVDPFMRRGSCIVLRSPATELRDNVCADTREGINYLTQGFEGGPTNMLIEVRVPKAPGLDTMIADNVTVMALYHRRRSPFDNNEVYAATSYGLGIWVGGWHDDPPMTRLTVWHTEPGTGQDWHQAAVLGKYVNFYLVDPFLLNEGGVGLAIGQFNEAYGWRPQVGPSRVIGGEIRGYGRAYLRVGQDGEDPWQDYSNLTVQTVIGFRHTNSGEQVSGVGIPQPHKIAWRNIKWLPMPGRALKPIELEQLPLNPQLPRQFDLQVENYQQVPGQNFRVYFPQSTDGGLTNPPATANATAHPEIQGLTDATGTPLPPPAPVDCVYTWSAWTDWHQISETQEQREQFPVVVTPASHGGTACPTEPRVEFRPVPPPPVVTAPTVTITSCTATLTSVRPSTATGTNWRVQYFAGTTAVTTASTTVTRTGVKLPAGTFNYRAVWTKSGQPTYTSGVTVKGCN